MNPELLGWLGADEAPVTLWARRPPQAPRTARLWAVPAPAGSAVGKSVNAFYQLNEILRRGWGGAGLGAVGVSIHLYGGSLLAPIGPIGSYWLRLHRWQHLCGGIASLGASLIPGRAETLLLWWRRITWCRFNLQEEAIGPIGPNRGQQGTPI